MVLIKKKKDDKEDSQSRIKVPHIGPRPRSSKPPVDTGSKRQPVQRVSTGSRRKK